jgi:hypothetical protein
MFDDRDARCPPRPGTKDDAMRDDEPRALDFDPDHGDRGAGRADADGITLANCPFHALAQDSTDLVCGMNLELLRGLVDGLETSRMEARLEPRPGRCCVQLTSR